MERKGKPTSPDALDVSTQEATTGATMGSRAKAILTAAEAEPVPDRLRILALALGEVLETPAADAARPSGKRGNTH